MRTHKSKKELYRYIAIAIAAIVLVTAVLAAIQLWDSGRGVFPSADPDDKYLEHNGTKYVLKDGIETFLVMGLDKYEGTSSADSYNNNQHADFLMLFVFDNNEKKVAAIHINRDTMAKMNVLGVAGQKIDTVTKQISLSHTYGNGKEISCRNTAHSVSGLLLDIKVNYYMSLTMESISIVNDLVGGVELTVRDDFTGIDDTLIKGQTVRLTGEQALCYVQTRYGLEDSSNSSRMERQKQYLGALYNQSKELAENDDGFLMNAVSTISNYILSDRTADELSTLAKKLSEYEFCGVRDIAGQSVKGEEFMEFYPYEESIKDIVVDLFCQPKN